MIDGVIGYIYIPWFLHARLLSWKVKKIPSNFFKTIKKFTQNFDDIIYKNRKLINELSKIIKNFIAFLYKYKLEIGNYSVGVLIIKIIDLFIIII